MARYFRCEEPTAQCPHARTGEVQVDRPGVCPLNDPDCERYRRPVPWLTAQRERRPLLVWGGGAAIGVGLLALLLLVFAGGGGVSDLEGFQQDLARLDGKLDALEDRSVDGQISPTAADWSALQQRVLDLRRRATSADAADLPRLHAELDRLEREESRLQQAALPDAGVAGQQLAAQTLVRELEALEARVEAAHAAVDPFDEDADLAYADLRDGVSDSMGRARQLERPDRSQRSLVPRSTVDGIRSAFTEVRDALDELAARTKPSFAPEAAGLRISASPELVDALLLPLLQAHVGGKPLGELEPGRWYLPLAGGDLAPGIVIDAAADAPYDPLINGSADLVLSDRPPDAAEQARFADAFGGQVLDSRAFSEVIALDAVALLGHPNAAGAPVGPADLTGERWRVHDADAALIGRLTGAGPMFDSVPEPLPTIADRGERALVLYHRCGPGLRARMLPYQPAPETRALIASPFSIATEDYGLSFRIIAAHSPKSPPAVKAFIDYLTSDAGQEQIAAAGFVDLRLRPRTEDVDPIVLATLANALGRDRIPSGSASRYSTNLRFGVDQDKLDIKAQADLNRLPRALARDFPGGRVVILGFTDSTGDAGYNHELSIRRATFISKRLQGFEIDAVPAGLGEQLPVDSNATEQGRSHNRRAEVWVVK